MVGGRRPDACRGRCSSRVGRDDDGAVELDRVARLADDDLVGELVTVRGIGRWTAEMFLMFRLGRLDVWPVLTEAAAARRVKLALTSATLAASSGRRGLFATTGVSLADAAALTLVVRLQQLLIVALGAGALLISRRSSSR